MKYSGKLKSAVSVLLGAAAALAALFCIFVRFSMLFNGDGNVSEVFFNTSETVRREISDESAQENTEQTDTSPQTSEETTDASSEQSGKTYPIIESHIEKSSLTYSNFSVKNTTDYDIDFDEIMSSPLPFEISDTHEVQVLIVHTHACESYLTEDNGTYPADYYPRSDDNDKNVTRVGNSIMRSLKEEGIGVVHCVTQHDNPSYDGSYYRSMQSIENYLDKYSNIKVILDIHRDSLGAGGEEGKIKPTFTYNGKKAAQLMIMTGYDSDGSYEFPDWKENLIFALKLQQTAEDMFPGMTRPLYFGNFVYNLNANNGSLLIEVGTDANTLEEAEYTGELLGKALAKVLQNS